MTPAARTSARLESCQITTRAPDRPGDVQRGHRRELVGVGGERAAVPGADRVGGRDHVGEAGGASAAARPGSARRRRRRARWSRTSCVAQRPVDVRAPPPHPAEQAQRDGEVGVVVVVGEDAGRATGARPAMRRGVLGRDVERLLEGEDHCGVPERDVEAQRREVGYGVIDPQQPDDRRAPRPTSGCARASRPPPPPARRRRRRRSGRSSQRSTRESILSAGAGALQGWTGSRPRLAIGPSTRGSACDGAPPGTRGRVVVGVVQQQHRRLLPRRRSQGS